MPETCSVNRRFYRSFFSLPKPSSFNIPSSFLSFALPHMQKKCSNGHSMKEKVEFNARQESKTVSGDCDVIPSPENGHESCGEYEKSILHKSAYESGMASRLKLFLRNITFVTEIIQLCQITAVDFTLGKSQST
jgi:hypothetical protein